MYKVTVCFENDLQRCKESITDVKPTTGREFIIIRFREDASKIVSISYKLKGKN